MWLTRCRVDLAQDLQGSLRQAGCGRALVRDSGGAWVRLAFGVRVAHLAWPLGEDDAVFPQEPPHLVDERRALRLRAGLRIRCSICVSCWASVLMATKRIRGRLTASRIAAPPHSRPAPDADPRVSANSPGPALPLRRTAFTSTRSPASPYDEILPTHSPCQGKLEMSGPGYGYKDLGLGIEALDQRCHLPRDRSGMLP